MPRGSLRGHSLLLLGPLGELALPLGEDRVDVAALRLGERRARHQAANFSDVAGLQGGLQMLALRRRLPELAPDPPPQAHRCLVQLGHRPNLDDRSPKAHPPRRYPRSVSGRRILVVSIVLLVLGAGALALAAVLLAGREDTAEPEPRASDTVEVSQRVSALEGEDPVTGDTVSLARVKKRPVVLVVWASWCGPCAEQARAVEAFAAEHEEDAAVIGLDLQDLPEDAQAFYERHEWTIPSIADEDGELAARLDIAELPTTLVLDTGRLIVSRIDGPATRRQLERGLAEAAGGG
jgi:cytochrome c biogenesis protein CcmG, thiol:disulfide interchange protein DsbE